MMMTRLTPGLLFVSVGLASACASPPRPASSPEVATIAFDRVAVVPMTGDTILPNMTVVVQGERIVHVGPAGRVPIPRGAQVIDGENRWLMPGLVDAHAHTLGPERFTRRLFLLGLTKGVTTAMILSGDSMAVALRDKYAAGADLGPTLYVAGPLAQDSLMSYEDGMRLAREYHAAGYDLIKVYNDLSRDGYRGVMLQARELRLPVVGHIVRSMDLEGVLGAGQRGIVHMEEYLHTYFGLRMSDTAHVARFDPNAIPYLAAITAQSGTYVTPTLVTWERMLALAEDLEQALTQPGIEYLGRVIGGALRRHGEGLSDRTPGQVRNHREALAFQRRMTRAFHEAGVPLLTGTDAPLGVTIPGIGLHRELQNLVNAGLSPLEALRAATRNAAEYVGRGTVFGTVEEGRRADLLLLEGNPLGSVSNAGRIKGVMVRGRWLSDERIAAELSALRESDD